MLFKRVAQRILELEEVGRITMEPGRIISYIFTEGERDFPILLEGGEACYDSSLDEVSSFTMDIHSFREIIRVMQSIESIFHEEFEKMGSE